MNSFSFYSFSRQHTDSANDASVADGTGFAIDVEITNVLEKRTRNLLFGVNARQGATEQLEIGAYANIRFENPVHYGSKRCQ